MTYGLTRMVAPTIEPLTAADMRAFLRIDLTDEDALLTELISSARQFIEDICNRAFITQTLKLTLPSWPACDLVRLPRAPLISVNSIQYRDSSGQTVTLADSLYYVATSREPGSITFASDFSWPLLLNGHPEAIEITYRAGYGAAAENVPSDARHLIKFLVAHFYETREPVNVGNIVNELPFALQAMINKQKVYM